MQVEFNGVSTNVGALRECPEYDKQSESYAQLGLIELMCVHVVWVLLNLDFNEPTRGSAAKLSINLYLKLNLSPMCEEWKCHTACWTTQIHTRRNDEAEGYQQPR